MKPYSAETRTTFLQLRARGTSLGAISVQLSVPKSTLGDWDKQLADEIARLRAIEWEAVEEQFGRNLEQDLRNMAERIRKWEARIDRMNPDNFDIHQVLALVRETRREYFRRRAILMAPLARPSRSSSKLPDESGRFSISSDSQPRNNNHLQQPPTESSGSTSTREPVGVPPSGGPGDDNPQASSETDSVPSAESKIQNLLKTTDQQSLHQKTCLAELTSKPCIPNLRP